MNTKEFKAPWNLNGKGYIFIYKFKKNFVNENGYVPEFLKGNFKGGFGSIMLVDYKKSNAGPYQELLFIPGKFRFGKKKYDTISKIYVSTMESVYNGRKNWGIPKELADFKFNELENGAEEITINKDGNQVANFKIKSFGPKFFVSTALLPFPLVQEYENKYMFTKFSGKGKGKLACLKDVSINKDLFPDCSKIKPIAIIKVEPFDITFPVAIEKNK